MLGDLMASIQPVEIKIFGNDQKKLQELSRQTSEIIADIPGIADPFDGIVIAGPSISVQPNYAKLAQYGITPSNLQYQLQTSLEGNVVGNLFEKEQYSTIRLVYPGSRKLSIADIDNLQIFLPDGRLKPIHELATVVINAGDAEIQRSNLQSMGVVTADLENRDLGSVMKDVQKKISSELTLPGGYYIEYGGAYAEQQKSFRELLMILIAASLLVFSVILFLFQKIKVALLILLIADLGI